MLGCVSQEQELKLADLEQRMTALKEQMRKFEQLTGRLQKLEADGAVRFTQINENLDTHDAKLKADRDQLRAGINLRLDEVNGQLEQLRKEFIDVVQNNNATITKSLDERLESLDVVIGALLLRIEELEKRPAQGKK